MPQFDRHAETYDEDLNRALSVTGEEKRFFAERRIAFLAKCLKKWGESPRSAVDYGCGTGDTLPLLKEFLGLELVIGLDVSMKSLEIAKSSHKNEAYTFAELGAYTPDAGIDLVYTNGVFHHIPARDRSGAIAYIHSCLRPKGIFAFCENNPLNPGTRYVMSQCSFDHDAIRIRAGAAKKLVEESGFQVLAVDYLFFFPKFLSAFRDLEPYLTKVPFGAQYQILCRKA
jgi:trans-aconitate methyltransferase